MRFHLQIIILLLFTLSFTAIGQDTTKRHWTDSTQILAPRGDTARQRDSYIIPPPARKIPGTRHPTSQRFPKFVDSSTSTSPDTVDISKPVLSDSFPDFTEDTVDYGIADWSTSSFDPLIGLLIIVAMSLIYYFGQQLLKRRKRQERLTSSKVEKEISRTSDSAQFRIRLETTLTDRHVNEDISSNSERRYRFWKSIQGSNESAPSPESLENKFKESFGHMFKLHLYYYLIDRLKPSEFQGDQISNTIEKDIRFEVTGVSYSSLDVGMIIIGLQALIKLFGSTSGSFEAALTNIAPLAFAAAIGIPGAADKVTATPELPKDLLRLFEQSGLLEPSSKSSESKNGSEVTISSGGVAILIPVLLVLAAGYFILEYMRSQNDTVQKHMAAAMGQNRRNIEMLERMNIRMIQMQERSMNRLDRIESHILLQAYPQKSVKQARTR